jgi:hypothetical protein
LDALAAPRIDLRNAEKDSLFRRVRAAECVMNQATKAIEIEDIEGRVSALEKETRATEQTRGKSISRRIRRLEVCSKAIVALRILCTSGLKEATKDNQHDAKLSAF